MERFKEFMLIHKITTTVTITIILINLYILLTMAIPSGQWKNMLWFNITMLPIDLIVFSFEHGVRNFDPDTKEFSTWRAIGIVLAIAYVAGVSFLGSQVIGLWGI